MKKNNYINKILFALCLSVIAIGCSDDDGDGGSSVEFAGIASSLYEEDATTSVTIPLRNGSVSESDIILQGSATVDEDYTFDGIDDDGIHFTILEDDEWEYDETVVIRIPSSGNATHTLTLVSNCEDLEGVNSYPFRGNWRATEYYCGFGVTTGSCDFGPYAVTLSWDPEHPNQLEIANFYGVAALHAYVEVDGAAGTVRFPDQDVEGDTSSPEITASTGTYTIDPCTGNGTMTLNLNYDGGDWIYYLQKP